MRHLRISSPHYYNEDGDTWSLDVLKIKLSLFTFWFQLRPLKDNVGTIFLWGRWPSRLFGTVHVCRSCVVLVLVLHAPVCAPWYQCSSVKCVLLPNPNETLFTSSRLIQSVCVTYHWPFTMFFIIHIMHYFSISLLILLLSRPLKWFQCSLSEASTYL